MRQAKTTNTRNQKPHEAQNVTLIAAPREVHELYEVVEFPTTVQVTKFGVRHRLPTDSSIVIRIGRDIRWWGGSRVLNGHSIPPFDVA